MTKEKTEEPEIQQVFQVIHDPLFEEIKIEA